MYLCKNHVKMSKISIKSTNNPTIVKFELDFTITNGKSYEFKNIDETKNAPLASQLFYLPFVKTVYISMNFIAIERFSIVEWEDVQDQVAEQIEEYIANGGIIIKEDNTKKIPVSIYAETTPNPSVQKFVSNKLLTNTPVECKNIDDCLSSPLAKKLFEFPFVKEIFIDENYISITKFDIADWNEITLELRSYIKEYIENGNAIVDETKIIKKENNNSESSIEEFKKLDSTSQQIVSILDEYIKPAVQGDGGNILFQSYNPTNKKVKVLLQGACNGCPSSTFTLKNGIENMLRQMLNDNEIIVEATN